MLRNPANKDRAIRLTYDQFRFGFANELSEEEAKALYDKYSVAGAGKVLFQAAFANINPADRGDGREGPSRPRPDADHLRR